MKGPIVHVGRYDKFMSPFINFVAKHFPTQQHDYFMFLVNYKHERNTHSAVHYHENRLGLVKTILFNLRVAWAMQKADKIMLHGLFSNSVVAILCFMPWLLKKSYWFVWGGDIYFRPASGQSKLKIKLIRWMRRRVIRKMGYIVTSIRGDYEKALEWHGTMSPNLPYFMYTNSLYHEVVAPAKADGKIRILVGNSAMTSNNHRQAFDIIAPYIDDSVEIICPLNYGDLEYGKAMAEEGKRRFGAAFKALLDYVPYDEYLKLLATVDIAVFNHDRQQAMSSTRVLLGMGARVYLRKETTSYETLSALGARVHDVSDFSLKLDKEESAHNQDVIRNYYSERQLKANMEKVFGKGS